MDLQTCRAAILGVFPELAGARFMLLATSWHSQAVDVDDRLIFKFPRHAAAAKALRKEAALLALVRPVTTMRVPDMQLYEGPPLFSRHDKLQGGSLLTADYDRVPEEARQRMARQLARFYAELHGLDGRTMARAGAEPIEPWQTPAEIRAKALPALPPALRRQGEEIVAAFASLPPDPHGATYGFFDGHGWNMAFDHARARLVGMFDFADSGFGPLHQEFIYSNFISPDLTGRIMAEYEALTGRALDRRRIAILTGFHRLSELAALAGDPEHRPAMIRHAADWLGRS